MLQGNVGKKWKHVAYFPGFPLLADTFGAKVPLRNNVRDCYGVCEYSSFRNAFRDQFVW